MGNKYSQYKDNYEFKQLKSETYDYFSLYEVEIEELNKVEIMVVRDKIRMINHPILNEYAADIVHILHSYLKEDGVVLSSQVDYYLFMFQNKPLFQVKNIRAKANKQKYDTPCDMFYYRKSVALASATAKYI